MNNSCNCGADSWTLLLDYTVIGAILLTALCAVLIYCNYQHEKKRKTDIPLYEKFLFHFLMIFVPITAWFKVFL